MQTLKVIGHINPDTDSTLSPIIYAWFLSTYKNIPASPFLSGEPNKEALYVLERFGVAKPEIISGFEEGDKVVLIDTNNLEELLPGIDKCEVVEIVDHHKLFGNISTSSPITLTMRPLACTATIIFEMIKASGIDLPKDKAVLLLAAIISDTLKFTSPTTTEIDIKSANKLSQLADVNIDELSSEMFAAKSDLTGMSIQDILEVDSKVFEINGNKLRVSVLETTNPENALSKISEIKSKMEELKISEGLHGILFYIVDILNTASTAVIISEFERDLVSKAHSIAVTSDTINLPGVVSRKKQIIPNFEKALA